MIHLLYEKMDIPEDCHLGKRLFKRMFYENAQLNASDKKAFSEDIDEILWQYTFKPETINIPGYEDEEREYHEIAIIQVNLKQVKRYKRIAEIIQRAIPYPALVVFVGDQQAALNLADKRISRVDRDKIVVEQFHHTDWLNLAALDECEAQFLNSCSVKSFSYNNFFTFYSDLTKRVVALNCAAHSGHFELELKGEGGIEVRLQNLAELERLQQESHVLRGKLKNEKQMGKQIELNIQMKKINENIAAIKTKI